ncbi:MAG TPA: hypothetical protein VIY52_24565 [Streptosporangiaceae bacterium]
MRKLVEVTLLSRDGVVGCPAEWALPYWDEENKDYAPAQLAEVDAFLLGRVTYEKFAAAWSQVSGNSYLDTINRPPKFVASASLWEAAWNATLITGDGGAEVAKPENQPGTTIMRYGTGQLDRTLISHGLIDEFHSSVFNRPRCRLKATSPIPAGWCGARKGRPGSRNSRLRWPRPIPPVRAAP